MGFCLLAAPVLSFAQDTNQGPPSSQENPKPATTQDEKAAPQSQEQSQPESQSQSTAPGAQLPNAPSSGKTEPLLEDLGFSPAQTQSDAARQALLDKRTHMLKVHQRLGLITTVPLIATVATSLNAGGKNTSTASRDLHTALGGLTGDLYFITAYYAIRAPRVPGTETRGPIRFHKAMAWIHGPGMIATPILGIMAFDQKTRVRRFTASPRHTLRWPSLRRARLAQLFYRFLLNSEAYDTAYVDENSRRWPASCSPAVRLGGR
jgi:hypothetical protein